MFLRSHTKGNFVFLRQLGLATIQIQTAKLKFATLQAFVSYGS